MKQSIFCVFIALISFCTISACSSSSNASDNGRAGTPITINLTTPNGEILGTQSDNIKIFKGIPYAKTPVQFAPPEDVEPWTGVLNCENFGAVVPQNLGTSPKPINLPISETDGLNLNIWTPAEATGDALPVYVWIHGGGFALGTGADTDYDGTAFAKQGIIVVTINYRMNAFGFLASQSTFSKYGTTGNWGILDQIKALEWVQRNIAAFGGDPNRVTVGGESAGAYSVSALIMSPLAEGLFQNAIMESGSMLGLPGNSQYARGNLERSIDMGRQLMHTFGAKDDSAGLEKLRKAKWNVFTTMSSLNADFTQFPAFMMIPVYDGHVMQTNPVKALKDGKINSVNLLWGFNSNEGLIFVPNTVDQDGYETLTAKIFGYDVGQKVLQKFPTDSESTAVKRSREILGHAMFMTVMKPYADALYNKGMNVYGYYFDYNPNGGGAAHASEIPYAFGTLPSDATDLQKQVSAEMHTRWANFIKYNDPGAGWGRYNPTDFNVMIFRDTPTFGVNPLADDVKFMEEIMFGEDSIHFN